jgi:hypothetical protein
VASGLKPEIFLSASHACLILRLHDAWRFPLDGAAATPEPRPIASPRITKEVEVADSVVEAPSEDTSTVLASTLTSEVGIIFL